MDQTGLPGGFVLDNDGGSTSTPAATLTREPRGIAAPPSGFVLDSANAPPTQLKPAPTASHSTLGDLGRSARGALSSGTGELVQELPNGRFRVRTDSGATVTYPTRAEADDYSAQAKRSDKRMTGDF